MHKFTLNTTRRTEFINLDREVQRIVTDLQVEEGMVHVFVPHTTAGIMINENADPDVKVDLNTIFDRMVPWQAGYAHAEGNAAAHAKAIMTGSSATVLVEAGRLQFGTWQSLYFAEYDGPRRREVWVQVMSTRALAERAT
jgi:secondary thiamine-phosphate synthase enzyme